MRADALDRAACFSRAGPECGGRETVGTHPVCFHEASLTKVDHHLGSERGWISEKGKSWGAFHQQFISERGDGRRFSQAKCPYDCDYVIDY